MLDAGMGDAERLAVRMRTPRQVPFVKRPTRCTALFGTLLLVASGCGMLQSKSDERVCQAFQDLIDANVAHVDSVTRKAMITIALGDAHKADDHKLRDAAFNYLSAESSVAPSPDFNVVYAKCRSLGHEFQVPATTTTTTTT